MAKGTVASACGKWEAVVKAVNAIFGNGGFTLLSEDAWATERPHFKPTSSLNDKVHYPRGRAFDRKREVRWREIRSGRYVITYLSESGAPPPEADLVVNNSEWEARNGVIQKLYGTWSKTTKDWVEVAVPGISQMYKEVVNETPPPNAMQVTAVDYSRDGLVQMTRFCAVESYGEE